MRAKAQSGFALLPQQIVTGQAETGNASKYLQQLCKHWSHKGQVEFDVYAGTISFASGNSVKLKATSEALEIEASVSPRGDLDRWKIAITDHLKRFAFREEFELYWNN
nr:DUF2218 domain-containing protein [Ruegeria halocynthiae]